MMMGQVAGWHVPILRVHDSISVTAEGYMT